jgi:DNA-directed RNA polymerase subunit N (RpoN/RPB10)
MALIPVRCMTCRSVTGNKWEPYVKLLREGNSSDEALDRMGVKAPCCRVTLFTHNDTSVLLLRYQALETDNMKASLKNTAGGVDDMDEGGMDVD